MLKEFQVANNLLDNINGGGTETLVKMTFSGMNAAKEAIDMAGACSCACGCGGGGAGSGAGAEEMAHL
jgi:hypothetical protein